MGAYRPCIFALPLLWVCSFAIAGADEAPPRFKPSGDEQAILDLTNEARAEEKLPALKPNALLFAVARAHSANMAKQAKMDHVLDGKNPSQRVDDAGYDYAWIGENVAYSDSLNVEEIFKGWMKSPHHRENILKDKYGEIGIGIAHNDKGEVYYTQVFGTPRKRR